MNYLDHLERIVRRSPIKATSSSIDSATSVSMAGLKKVTPNVFTYSRLARGQWAKPEYDFRNLQLAQHNDGILLRGIKRKADRILISGFDIVGSAPDAVQYVKNRIKQMEFVSNKSFTVLVRNTAEELIRQNNCMWAKVRSAESSSGEVRKDLDGTSLEPVAAYYMLPFETLELKHKESGELKKVRQTMTTGERKEFRPSDVIHFMVDQKAGFTVGTPELLPALEDIALLRRMEENVEELVETNLFPVYHYQIGTDAFPERNTPEGIPESVAIQRKIEYMPAGSVYVSDHRHQISALGSEGKALVIDNYLNYFRQRAISSAGFTEIDLGMSGQANRSTANTLSKVVILDIEAIQTYLKLYIDMYVIRELLLEGGYDVFDPDNDVHIKFGIVDREERIAVENQQIQLFANNIRNLDEVRTELGDKPFDDTWMEHSFYTLFEEPLAMIKAMGMPGSAAGETLANEVPSSNVTPEAVNKEKTFAKQQAKAQVKARAAGQGRKPGTQASSTARRTAAGKSRPSNQHGTRSAPKLNKDIVVIGDSVLELDLPEEISFTTLDNWKSVVLDRYALVKDSNVSIETVANSLLYRLRGTE